MADSKGSDLAVVTTLADANGLYVFVGGVSKQITKVSLEADLAIAASQLDVTLSGTNTGDEPDSSATVKGIVELATTTEASTGTDTARAVTAAGVKQYVDDNVDTAVVLTATSGATAGAVGTYVFACGTTTNRVFGTTEAGSNLNPTSAAKRVYSDGNATSSELNTGSALSGTWRCMGEYEYKSGGGSGDIILDGATLWLRTV